MIRSKYLAALNETNEMKSSSIPSDNDYLSSLETEIYNLVSDAIVLYIKAGPWINLENAIQRLESCGAWQGAVKLCLAAAKSRDPSDVAVDCLKHGRRPSTNIVFNEVNMGPNKYRTTRSNRKQYSSELEVTEARLVCLC